MTNCLLFRSLMYCNSLEEILKLDAINNLFYGGNVYLSAASVSGTEFAQITFHDNLFFTNSITTNGVMDLTHSHNAYVTNHNRLGTLATGDVILTNMPTFETSIPVSIPSSVWMTPHGPVAKNVATTVVDEGQSDRHTCRRGNGKK